MKQEVKNFLDTVLNNIRETETARVKEQVEAKFRANLKTMVENGILTDADAKEYSRDVGIKYATTATRSAIEVDPCFRGSSSSRVTGC